ncbi:cupin domain-containing protein [Algoriphagus sp. H41]|uniref:Cupin domain-containing protein n=1 Tax=Algoriphagus oliviformis TaxID=2811231 RepID=A0ABS3C411_9BACT|nr:cupin domain-containing protein [Algoriphagus oliviformis]MBN7811853.1 cupin domain-containing protein [Algoriphagus oliviformis]
MKTMLFLVALLCSAALHAQTVQTFTLEELPTKPVNELLNRAMISGEQGTIGYFTYKKGAVVPTHQHPNEQYSLITKGSVKVTIGEREYIVKAGQGIIIPPNLPHSFVALEDDTIDIDFFAPPRADWIDGTDNYYKDN